MKSLLNGLVNRFIRNESGEALITTLVAFAIVSVIVAAFLSGLATALGATSIADKISTADSLARSQMEWAKDSPYVFEATEYTPASMPEGEHYIDYSASIAAQPLNSPDDGIQRITVTVDRGETTVFILNGYKVNR
jgi:type II secretory pathway pseudopilin PulG